MQGHAPFDRKHFANPTIGDVVQWMCRLAWQGRETCRARSLDIIAEVQSGDYASEALAIYAWVRRNIRYAKDPDGLEFIQSPDRLLEKAQGDCDDQAVFLAAHLMAVGHPCSFVLAAFNHDPIPTHVFCRMETKHGPMVLDPVAGRDTSKMLADITRKLVVPVAAGVDGMVPTGLDSSFHGWHGWGEGGC